MNTSGIILKMILLSNMLDLVVNAKRPVVIIPRYEGSRLETKLVNQYTSKWYCVTDNDWFTIWLDLELQLPFYFKCFRERMKLKERFCDKTVLSKNINRN
ncbi:hypothetical protein A3Q56_07273 [Intoshia linei]|uniref:DDE-1 domain-containing protein n=1 Tax=Intoshia linei TaxID=1819745 RepID=A0A177ASM6_9BILA|nr:hypothetical protein A3Q56_07273 [Intoshia linei]